MSRPMLALFTRATLARIEDAAVDAALFVPHRRELLMYGLPARLWGSLSSQPDAISQLTADLAALNALTHAPGVADPPLALWLDNAARLIDSGGRPGAEHFRRWADEARSHAAALAEPSPAEPSPAEPSPAAPEPSIPSPAPPAAPTPAAPPSLAELLAAGAADLIAEAFPTPGEARALLLAAGVPPGRLPPMSGTPHAWWIDVLQRVTAGVASLAQLLDHAARQRPHDPRLRQLADRFPSR